LNLRFSLTFCFASSVSVKETEANGFALLISDFWAAMSGPRLTPDAHPPRTSTDASTAIAESVLIL
jgi:hypothetical protein